MTNFTPDQPSEASLAAILLRGNFEDMGAEGIKLLSVAALAAGVEIEYLSDEQLALTDQSIASQAMYVTKPLLRQFAEEHDYTAVRASRSWDILSWTTYEDAQSCRYPSLRWGSSSGRSGSESEASDVRGIRLKLIDSGLSPYAWVRGSRAHVRLLTHFVIERLAGEPATQVLAELAGSVSLASFEVTRPW